MEKKTYNQPTVEQTPLITDSMIMAGSPNINNLGDQGIDPD